MNRRERRIAATAIEAKGLIEQFTVQMQALHGGTRLEARARAIDILREQIEKRLAGDPETLEKIMPLFNKAIWDSPDTARLPEWG